MTNPTGQQWKQLDFIAIQHPQRFLAEFDDYANHYANPSDQRQLIYLKAKALHTMQDIDGAEKLVLNLLEEAIEANDLAITAKSNVLLAKCCVSKNAVDKEIPCLEVALSAAKQARDNDLIAEVLCHFAAYYLRQRDRVQTLLYLEKAEKQLTVESDPVLRLKILIDTGSAYYYFKQYDKAILFISSALELSFKLNDINNQLMLLNNISTLYGMVGKFKEAEEVLRKGLAICEEHSIAFQKVQFLFSLGVLFMRLDKYAEALPYLLECESAANSINLNNPKYLSDLHSNLAGCYRNLGQTEQVWEQLELASQAVEASGDPSMKMGLNMNKANYLNSIGKFSDARKLLQEVIRHSKKNKIYDLLIVAQLNVYQSYDMEKNYQKAASSLLYLHHIHEEYHNFLMTEQTKDYDQRIQALMKDYNEVQQQYSSLQKDMRHNASSDFVGKSEAHKKVLEAALLAAQHPYANVLILGESGTGKDVVARLIHYNSVRRDALMVSVNMAAISPSLMESEFFGHKKGSFTGALSDNKGHFIEAHNGTLFLDEISEMPFNMQAKLLRVLESRKLTPVGSSKELVFDTRVISSTNQDILKMIQSDLFRLDLYHRLNTIEIHIPPLRERPEDIEILILHYVEKLARELKVAIPRIDSSFIRGLQEYRFPGNVRELKNIIERLLIMQSGVEWDQRTLAKLPSLNLGRKVSTERDIRTRKENLEKTEIIEALQKCEGKQKDAARLLGISESTLTRRISAYKLEIYTRKGK